jgi:phosphate/sulfate permease
MLVKSFLGYGLAAIVSFIVWMVITKFFNEDKYPMNREVKKNWRIFQFITTAFLWYSWLSHDVANIAVYLPRSMDIFSMIIVSCVFTIFLFFMFYERGGKIQKVVKSKTGTKNVRAATLIDLVYVVILMYFKQYNNIPMSTTWVFIGLLTGRELAISLINSGKVGFRTALPVVLMDLGKVLFGLVVGVAMLLLLEGRF